MEWKASCHDHFTPGKQYWSHVIISDVDPKADLGVKSRNRLLAPTNIVTPDLIAHSLISILY